MTTVIRINDGITADFGFDWVGFKQLIDGTKRRLPHMWTEASDYYTVVATDGSVYYYLQIMKSDPPSSDQTDFENSFKGGDNNLAIRTDRGVQVVSQTPYAYTEENARFVGYQYSCPPGTSQHEEPITTNIRLQGGYYWVSTPNLGDAVSLSVVDKNNILGNGANIVLAEYVKNHSMPPWNHQMEIIAPSAALVISGLYLRMTYTNSGSQDVNFGVTYRWYEQPIS